MTTLRGKLVGLRPASRDDIPRLAEIRRQPDVYAHWRGGDDMVAAVEQDFAEDSVKYVIELEGRVVGWVQWAAEEEPDYRHAGIDIYVDAEVRQSERGPDGTWHDGLLMDMLVGELTD